jgi:hypothetical protein
VARRSKFLAVPTVVDGKRFASKAEAKRYGELCWLRKARAIRDLECQPKFPLAVVDIDGVLVVIGTYRADFSYVDVATNLWWSKTSRVLRGARRSMRGRKNTLKRSTGFRFVRWDSDQADALGLVGRFASTEPTAHGLRTVGVARRNYD